jgi:alpha-tubulin suppressor-like RCC1 family protein
MELELRTVAAGGNRSFFVDANGALLACGAEEEGENGLLGLRAGTIQTAMTVVLPTPVPSMAGVYIRAVVCHDDYNLAVSEAGQVLAWGRTTQPSPPDDLGWRMWRASVPTVMEGLRNHRVRQVVAGYYHCAAVTEDGALFTWATGGKDDDEPATPKDEPVPELGHGRIVHDFGVPHRVLALEGVRIFSVAVGHGLTVAVTEAGEVYSCGLGDGRLGNGQDEEEDVFLPTPIEALDGVYVAAVAAGDYHALALTRCGRVYSWGSLGRDNMAHGHGTDGDEGGDADNTHGDVIDYSHVPQLIKALVGKHVRAIAAGPSTSCAVTEEGALYPWGSNAHGNLGHGDVRDRNRPKLVQGLHGIRVVGVSMFHKHTLALAADGGVDAFGKGWGLGIGQEGEGEGADAATRDPRRIPDLVCLVPRP